MIPSLPDPGRVRSIQRTTGAVWLGAAWQVLVACGLLWTAGGAEGGAASRRAFEVELLACQHRLVTGYTTSGIRVSDDDAMTIAAACRRAVQERLQAHR